MVDSERGSIGEEQEPLLTPRNDRQDEIYGLCLLLASTVCAVGMALFIKLSGAEDIPPTEIIFVQAFIQGVFAFSGCKRKGVSLLGSPPVRKWLGLFGLFGGTLLLLDAYCATHMPLGDFIVIAQLNVVFTNVLAIILLDEAFRYFDLICIVLCMTGTVLVVKPKFLFGSDQQLPLLPTVGAIVMALLGSFMSIVTRKIRKEVYFLVFGIYSSFGCLIISIPTAHTFIFPEDRKTYLWLLMSGVCLFGSGSLIHRGTQLVPAGPGSIIRINRVIVAIPLGMLVFHEYPDALGLVGTCMIVVGTATLLFVASRPG